jgi:hypothetical protein
MNSSQILYSLGFLLLSAIVWYVKKTFFSVPEEVPTPKNYVRYKGVVKYKYLVYSVEDDKQPFQFKIWCEQLERHIFTVPYEDVFIKEESEVWFLLEKGEYNTALIDSYDLDPAIEAM